MDGKITASYFQSSKKWILETPVRPAPIKTGNTKHFTFFKLKTEILDLI